MYGPVGLKHMISGLVLYESHGYMEPQGGSLTTMGGCVCVCISLYPYIYIYIYHIVAKLFQINMTTKFTINRINNFNDLV